MRGLSKRSTGLSIPPLADLTEVEDASLAALKTELREQERNGLLKEIDGWLLDRAEADDVDGAEYDADLCRKIARDLAEHFKP